MHTLIIKKRTVKAVSEQKVRKGRKVVKGKKRGSLNSTSYLSQISTDDDIEWQEILTHDLAVQLTVDGVPFAYLEDIE